MSFFERLPGDILLHDLLPQLALSDLLHLCKSNRQLNQICHSEKLWELKLKHDFPHINIIPPNWRDLYFSVKSGVYTAYPDAPPKVANLNWRQYHKLLKCARIYPTIHSKCSGPYRITDDWDPETYVGFMFIVPTITTFGMLITQINNSLTLHQLPFDHYNIVFSQEFIMAVINGKFYSSISTTKFRANTNYVFGPVTIHPLRLPRGGTLARYQSSLYSYDTNEVIFPVCDYLAGNRFQACYNPERD